MNYLDVFLGALRYEFRMQARRPAIWITCLGLGLILSQFHQPWGRPTTSPIGEAIVYWTMEMHSILAIAVGILLADRLSRDQRTRVDELFTTYRSPSSMRLFGKYMGSTLATLLPVIIIYSVGVGYLLARWQTLAGLPIALAAFACIVLPGIFFIASFSLACPALMWTPLYQFLFVGYWFWGNLLPGFGIPSLSETPLTPVGSYMCTAFFNAAKHEGVCNPGIEGVTAWQGIESVLLLICVAFLVMLMLPLLLRWQRGRRS
ncbi:hypothetical protein KSD_78310 [Ktedonobacter sp. SOSP1-85]|uniref:hypothetical protein n=1 Tax=Ktedonobacter sp. SOSP1-85 TaxID=2778367 RepID=UPI0019165808|nr:hypothetical protein [Ktedonobacter sp. SOSP1-85]GHO80060.1 hypothetical protein KSD_78310 [Ktedonobacter sp. SOSP1-85]